ncbi:unnamed protein product [Rodentolepis nana]|uniref:Signal recognition particle 9 kDa protein n=1 Tax=Rodentolepis nana TaxID=102285 RepID=A0A0R3T5N9_RODNA|nr:unnamed protein product [Rodentolepis nana]
MTLYENWDAFQRAAELLYGKNPSRFRIVSKYRHNDPILVVKATNDVETLKFETNLAQDLKNYDKFLALLMRSMASK